MLVAGGGVGLPLLKKPIVPLSPTITEVKFWSYSEYEKPIGTAVVQSSQSVRLGGVLPGTIGVDTSLCRTSKLTLGQGPGVGCVTVLPHKLLEKAMSLKRSAPDGR